jgi:hypothetical protein
VLLCIGLCKYMQVPGTWHLLLFLARAGQHDTHTHHRTRTTAHAHAHAVAGWHTPGDWTIRIEHYLSHNPLLWKKLNETFVWLHIDEAYGRSLRGVWLGHCNEQPLNLRSLFGCAARHEMTRACPFRRTTTNTSNYRKDVRQSTHTRSPHARVACCVLTCGGAGGARSSDPRLV